MLKTITKIPPKTTIVIKVIKAIPNVDKSIDPTKIITMKYRQERSQDLVQPLYTASLIDLASMLTTFFNSCRTFFMISSFEIKEIIKIVKKPNINTGLIGTKNNIINPNDRINSPKIENNEDKPNDQR